MLFCLNWSYSSFYTSAGLRTAVRCRGSTAKSGRKKIYFCQEGRKNRTKARVGRGGGGGSGGVGGGVVGENRTYQLISPRAAGATMTGAENAVLNRCILPQKSVVHKVSETAEFVFFVYEMCLDNCTSVI